MSFADPLSITYNAVSKDLVKVNQDGYGSDYFLDEGTIKFQASIRHTIPAKGGTGESHMLRLDVLHYDADGVYLRTDSSWSVIKTFDASQDPTELGYCADAQSALITSANAAKLIGREN